MRRAWLAAVVGLIGCGAVAGPVRADDAVILKRLEQLEQEVRDLKRQLQQSHDTLAAKPDNAAIVTAGGKDGFSIQSADQNFQLKLKGVLQTDGRFFMNNESANSTFVIRKARPIIEGTLWHDYAFKLMPDFGNGTTVLQDAYMEVNYWPEARFRAGKFKTPFGLERLQPDENAPFMEPGLTTNLVPNRDVGVELYGDVLGQRLSYAVGAFNGVPDRGSADTDADTDKDVVARLFAQPFRGGPTLLQGLGLGVAATYGHREGTPASYITAGQQTFFSYRSDTVADGRHIRFSPQAYYYWGPVGVLAEYVTSTQRLRRAGVTSEVDHTAWQLASNYVLTGEDAAYKGIKVRAPFSLSNGTWGAWELVGRFSSLHVDDDVFSTLAPEATSAELADAWNLGVNWYLNQNFKWMLEFEHTAFRGGSSGDRDSENALLTRWQVAF